MTWAREPALIVGLIEAAIVLLVAFGVPITSEQKAAVIGFSAAVVALIGAFVIRQNVKPVGR